MCGCWNLDNLAASRWLDAVKSAKNDRWQVLGMSGTCTAIYESLSLLKWIQKETICAWCRRHVTCVKRNDRLRPAVKYNREKKEGKRCHQTTQPVNGHLQFILFVPTWNKVLFRFLFFPFPQQQTISQEVLDNTQVPSWGQLNLFYFSLTLIIASTTFVRLSVCLKTIRKMAEIRWFGFLLYNSTTEKSAEQYGHHCHSLSIVWMFSIHHWPCLGNKKMFRT